MHKLGCTRWLRALYASSNAIFSTLVIYGNYRDPRGSASQKQAQFELRVLCVGKSDKSYRSGTWVRGRCEFVILKKREPPITSPSVATTASLSHFLDRTCLVKEQSRRAQNKYDPSPQDFSEAPHFHLHLLHLQQSLTPLHSFTTSLYQTIPKTKSLPSIHLVSSSQQHSKSTSHC